MTKCFFHKYKIEPTFKEVETLQKFLTSRHKIASPEVTNLCAKHQRQLANEIKKARFLALIPYISYRTIRR